MARNSINKSSATLFTFFAGVILNVSVFLSYNDPNCISAWNVLGRSVCLRNGALAATVTTKGNKMSNLTMSSINCNSLNMSDVSKISQNRKLLAIARLKTDIIFLSDIRLSNKSKVSCSNDIEKCFRTNPFGNYLFFHNSTKNKRGVGLLLNNKLDPKVLRRKDDINENYLLLEVELNKKVYILGAIYGPNNVDVEFFNDLTRDLLSLGNQRVVLAGDWNCTPSSEEVGINLDVLNMRSLPNRRHSELIQELCNQFDLLDPFRFKYPDVQDFTFIPRCPVNKNRSRIDFFLMNEIFTREQFDCSIDTANRSTMFDHRAIFLTLDKAKSKKNHAIKVDNRILKDDIVEWIINISVSECFLIHTRDGALMDEVKQRLLGQVGLAKTLIRDIGPPPNYFIATPLGQQRIEVREGNLVRLAAISNAIKEELVEDPDPDPDIFLETLLFMIKNELIVYQAHALKVKKNQSHDLEQRIRALKMDPDPDFDSIIMCEKRFGRGIGSICNV
jgi:exonuclease III